MNMGLATAAQPAWPALGFRALPTSLQQEKEKQGHPFPSMLVHFLFWLRLLVLRKQVFLSGCTAANDSAKDKSATYLSCKFVQGIGTSQKCSYLSPF